MTRNISHVAAGGVKSSSWYSLTSRSLEDAWTDDDGNYTYRFEVESSARSEAAPTSNSTINITHIQKVVSSQVQNYKAAAESKAYEFYQNSPSEWTDGQWEFVMMSFLGMLLLSCCFILTCCAYCCIYRGRDDNDEPPAKDASYLKRMRHNRLKRHLTRYRKDREDDDVDTIESQPTSISVASSFEMTKNEKKESLLKKKGRSKCKRTDKRTSGTYVSPTNMKSANVSECRAKNIEPYSPGSVLSTFEVESSKMKTPRRSNSRAKV